MQTREDLVELARACLEQARVSENPVIVAELTRLAKGYQMRAASMDTRGIPTQASAPSVVNVPTSTLGSAI